MTASIPQSDNTSRTAAIYCRISSDKTGAGLGVERQESDCRELAERLGYTVTHVLKDNDISAYSGKPRPGYRRLLELMRSGEIDVALAWHTDRLHRSMVELEEYVTASERGGVTTHTVKAGPVDLSTPSGRLVARQLGAVARYEVEHMIERQRAAKLDAAKQGKFRGGQRPFGFEAQRVAIREDEAAIVREMAQQVIDGYSFRTVAVGLNRRGVTTQHGKEWNALKVRNVLIRPINAGIDEHLGVQRPAQSPAIFTPDEWKRLTSAIEDNRRRSSHPGKFRVHLLSGMLFCGNCGARMYCKSKQQRDGSMKPQVWCPGNNVNTGMPSGCGKVSRMMAPIVDLITDAVMYRLDSSQLANELEQQNSTHNPTHELARTIQDLEARLSELNNDFYVTKLLDRREFEQLRASTKAEIADHEKRIKEYTSTALLGGIDVGADVRAKWDGETIEWQRDVLGHLIDRIIVHPRAQKAGYKVPRYKSWKFDPDLIEVRWSH